MSVKWFETDDGVRRSKRRKWESDDTEERRDDEWGEKAAL